MIRTLDVRRHTIRLKPGQKLSPGGIELARLVGAESGPYSRVVSSPLARAADTAVEMGFEVDETLAELARMPSGALDDWPLPFASASKLVGAGGAAAELANQTAGVWRGVIEAAPDGGRALIVTHGGIIELGAVAAVPAGEHRSWGGPIGYCEGVRLTFDGDFLACQVLRVPERYRLIAN